MEISDFRHLAIEFFPENHLVAANRQKVPFARKKSSSRRFLITLSSHELTIEPLGKTQRNKGQQ
ncbi:hypothetical protein LQ948_06885 [Jiella sp. MQZ9-1]|nr:hypothetical protein [Jiella flava]MCD2470928.1 hypothetical protein [Jiella flava]